MQVTWSAENADIEDEWSWGVKRQWSEDDWAKIIAPKLEHRGSLSWGEIDTFSSVSGHKMHHNMKTEAVCDEAQLRLIEIERYSDTVFRFRLGNKRRLWGFRNVAQFEIVWFDPAHNIYPIDPDQISNRDTTRRIQ